VGARLEHTTVPAVVAGGAFGGLVAWGVGLLIGHPVEPAPAASFTLLGSFLFGVWFPR
jgi:fluoride ion exporter CrcB/FEX